MPASEFEMVSVEEAWGCIAACIEPLPIKLVGILEALGCVLGLDIVAPEDVPSVAVATMDGFAVASADVAAERRIIGEQPAGAPIADLRVLPGTAVRIMTGSPLPPGADAVVPVEDAQEGDGFVRISGSVQPGQYVRPAGCDVAAGQVVLHRGAELGPAELGLLATVGVTSVPIHPLPRVAILTTGNEVVPPDVKPRPGQVRDANIVALQAAVLQTGFKVALAWNVPDDARLMRQALLEASQVADVILTSGGVSMGKYDYVGPVLEEMGRVHFRRVAVRPGKPFTFAELGRTLVFALPGNPVSSLVAFELFVRPALRKLAGFRRLFRPQVTARLEHPVRHEPDRVEFQRAIVEKRENDYWAHTTGGQASSRLLSLVGANALLRLPTGVGELPEGAEVMALLIDQPEVA